MANGSNRKIEECQICGKAVKWLNIHMKIHNSDLKAFKCGYCEKGFKTKSELTVHDHQFKNK